MATARQSLSAIKDAGNTYIMDNQTKKVFLYIPYANTAKFTFKGNDVSAKAKGEDCVTFNLPSELSIELGVQLMNLDILGFIDHNITVNVIKGDRIVEKKILKLPKQVKNVIKCKNPRCVTSIEQELDQIFLLSDEKREIYRCKYCEEKYTNPNRRKIKV